MYIVVDVEFHPKLHFLTHQPSLGYLTKPSQLINNVISIIQRLWYYLQLRCLYNLWVLHGFCLLLWVEYHTWLFSCTCLAPYNVFVLNDINTMLCPIENNSKQLNLLNLQCTLLVVWVSDLLYVTFLTKSHKTHHLLMHHWTLHALHCKKVKLIFKEVLIIMSGLLKMA